MGHRPLLHEKQQGYPNAVALHTLAASWLQQYVHFGPTPRFVSLSRYQHLEAQGKLPFDFFHMAIDFKHCSA
ncbi:hypothetical protein PC116_g14645 [Phytophthora cactorum]|uniref:Uncharacterized protein n=1 Tax=Phytophthora cactorum TaxID=29920 RepID=A0A8T1D7N1_9STRA|nr:hypothetical protein Pcac1_g25727 [Phytophthora cactorum]KAG2912474.1 hypothetical protein PC114_g8894 [Phytophthora cactorum]KAG2936908.1 hypothetical protein PC117_g11908 [Phytophthora cactorum]KAG3024300.1 hypothetical protein PC119_g8561 [Phytophthora cactorum]KAG3163407.1 hypothetical protein C6341_g12959 [Phytophthora cactorum]